MLILYAPLPVKMVPRNFPQGIVTKVVNIPISGGPNCRGTFFTQTPGTRNEQKYSELLVYSIITFVN